MEVVSASGPSVGREGGRDKAKKPKNDMFFHRASYPTRMHDFFDKFFLNDPHGCH